MPTKKSPVTEAQPPSTSTSSVSVNAVSIRQNVEGGATLTKIDANQAKGPQTAPTSSKRLVSIRPKFKKAETPIERDRRLMLGEYRDAVKLPQPQSVDQFMQVRTQPKVELIEDILYRRDRIALIGRRRNGKTTLTMNIALCGAGYRTHYLGHKVLRRFTTIGFFLEDDTTDIQNRLRSMGVDEDEHNPWFYLYNQDDFDAHEIPYDITAKKFTDFIEARCAEVEPDLIILDNLGLIINGDYSNGTLIEQVRQNIFKWNRMFDAAVLVPAHPRKSSHDGDNAPDLVNRTEMFFEECMGSSHFINSCGSLWGIQRVEDTDVSHIVLGAQRTGTQTITAAEKTDDDWLEITTNVSVAIKTVVKGNQRKDAWVALTKADKPFNYTMAHELVKQHLKSPTSFSRFWRDLKRVNVLVQAKEAGKDFYRCTDALRAPGTATT